MLMETKDKQGKKTTLNWFTQMILLNITLSRCNSQMWRKIYDV